MQVKAIKKVILIATIFGFNKVCLKKKFKYIVQESYAYWIRSRRSQKIVSNLFPRVCDLMNCSFLKSY